jgi:hypothetical protein
MVRLSLTTGWPGEAGSSGYAAGQTLSPMST